MTDELGILSDCVTGKRRFESEGEARGALRFAGTRAGVGGKKPIGVYECRLCGGWHLTSMRKRNRH